MLGLPSAGLGIVGSNWLTGTPAATWGTELGDPGATPHTKSTTASLIGTGLSAPGYWIEVHITGTGEATADSSALCDIMYDPAGGTSWSVLIPNLVCGFRIVGTASGVGGASYWFPLYVPRGSTIGARWQSIRASPLAGTRARVAVTVWGGFSKPPFWYGQSVTAVGAATAASAGLDINPGSTGAYSAWTSIGGTTNPNFGFLTIGAQGTTTVHTADIYFVQYGYGSTQIPGAQIRFGYTTSEVLVQNPPFLGTWSSIAAGTQLQVRATGSDATSEDPSVIVYGVS